jgi:hypothetical protein
MAPVRVSLAARAECPLIDVADPEPGPGLGQALGNGPADPGSAGGDERAAPARRQRWTASAWRGLPSFGFKGWLSKPEHLPAQVEIVQQRPGRPFVDHGAALEDVGPVGECEHEVEIVLDYDDRDLVPEPVEGLE